MNTDFQTHHIEGFARAAEEAGLNGYFKVPLFSHVTGNLWQGGCQPGAALPEDFAYVVSLCPWGKYKLGPNTHRDGIRMYDSGDLPDLRQLFEIAERVNEYRAKGKTLVHCQAGLNRSGLVAGLALVLDGMKPADAVALLREKRCDMVLCNEAFRHWLLNYRVLA